MYTIKYYTQKMMFWDENVLSFCCTYNICCSATIFFVSHYIFGYNMQAVFTMLHYTMTTFNNIDDIWQHSRTQKFPSIPFWLKTFYDKTLLAWSTSLKLIVFCMFQNKFGQALPWFVPCPFNWKITVFITEYWNICGHYLFKLNEIFLFNTAWLI